MAGFVGSAEGSKDFGLWWDIHALPDVSGATLLLLVLDLRPSRVHDSSLKAPPVRGKRLPHHLSGPSHRAR